MNATKRTVLCVCGNDMYLDTLGAEGRVWECTNCSRETPRKRVNRKTNKQKALAAFQAIMAEWEPTDRDLDALIASGDIKNGSLLVHAAAFNYHLGQLLSLTKPTTWELGYHTASAHKDLEAAQRYVAARRAS